MKKSLVLLAGYPGTGKSYLMLQIQEQYPAFRILSPDEYKEEMWNRYGFDTMEEKETDIQKAWMQYYADMEDMMKMGISILSDYPFSEKQKSKLEVLAVKHAYQIVTIRLLADLNVLYERQRTRDLDVTRHPGHIAGSYHEGDVIQNRDHQPCMVGYEEFMNRCKNRGYGTFALGTVLELDVTDFSRADYLLLLIQLKNILIGANYIHEN